MIGFKAYRSTPTTLELDGPILSYTQQPIGVTTEGSGVTLVGIATALPVGTGSISYQWYENGYGAVATSSTITGTATTALTLTALNYNDSGREFFLEASLIDKMDWRASQPLDHLLPNELQWSDKSKIGFCGDWFDTNSCRGVESAMHSSLGLVKFLNQS